MGCVGLLRESDDDYLHASYYDYVIRVWQERTSKGFQPQTRQDKKAYKKIKKEQREALREKTN